LDRLLGWLKKEWTGWKLFLGPILCLLISLAYLKLIMVSGISFFQTPIKPDPPSLNTAFILATITYYFFSALWEELVFRVPINIFASHLNKPKNLLIFIIVLKPTFGRLARLAHNYRHSRQL